MQRVSRQEGQLPLVLLGCSSCVQLVAAIRLNHVASLKDCLLSTKHTACVSCADERVQLERLRDLLLGSDGQLRAVSSHALRTPMPLDLTDAEQQLLEAYQRKAEAWGWRWVAPAQHQGRSSGFGRQAAPVLTHVPLLWGATLSAADLKVGCAAVGWAV